MPDDMKDGKSLYGETRSACACCILIYFVENSNCKIMGDASVSCTHCGKVETQYRLPNCDDCGREIWPRYNFCQCGKKKADALRNHTRGGGLQF